MLYSTVEYSRVKYLHHSGSHHSEEGAEETIFGINFCYLWILGRPDMKIIVVFGPSLALAVSICSNQTDDLLSNNQELFGPIFIPGNSPAAATFFFFLFYVGIFRRITDQLLRAGEQIVPY